MRSRQPLNRLTCRAVAASDRNLAVLVAAVLVAVEGLVLLVTGVGYALAGALGDAESVAGAELGAALIAGCGVLLLLAARGLLGHRRWARAPVVVVQLLAVPVGVSLLSAGVWAPAVLLLALAGATLAALASRPGRAGFEPER
jgi:hypothetical protein